MKVREYLSQHSELFDNQKWKTILENDILIFVFNSILNVSKKEPEGVLVQTTNPLSVKNVFSWCVIKNKNNYYAVGVNETPAYGFSPQKIKISEQYFLNIVLLEKKQKELFSLMPKIGTDKVKKFFENETDFSKEDIEQIEEDKEELYTLFFEEKSKEIENKIFKNLYS